MRVLYLVHQYPPEHVSGTELYTQSVARVLASLGHQAGIFYRHHSSGQGLEWSIVEKKTARCGGLVRP